MRNIEYYNEMKHFRNSASLVGYDQSSITEATLRQYNRH